MNKSIELHSLLLRMSEILDSGGQIGWANRLSHLAETAISDPLVARDETGRLFGGMGSLNDIVIFIDGRAPESENNEFDHLRSRLYDLFHEADKC